HPDKTAIICAGRRWTYREIEEQSGLVAQALVDAGVEHGDRVAICLDNGIEAIVSLFGVLKAGGAFVLVSPHARGDRLSQVVTHSRSRTLITGLDRIAAVTKRAGDLTPARRADTDLAALVYTSGST